MTVAWGRGRRRLVGRVGAAALAAGLSGCGAMSGMETRARILAEPPCTDFVFPIYFARRSSELSGPASRVIVDAGRNARDCMLASVLVIGLEGDRAASAAAPSLSQERARNLGQALAAAGLSPVVFQRSPLGAAAPPPVGPEPRRADVFVRFQH